MTMHNRIFLYINFFFPFLDTVSIKSTQLASSVKSEQSQKAVEEKSSKPIMYGEKSSSRKSVTSETKGIAAKTQSLSSQTKKLELAVTENQEYSASIQSATGKTVEEKSLIKKSLTSIESPKNKKITGESPEKKSLTSVKSEKSQKIAEKSIEKKPLTSVKSEKSQISAEKSAEKKSLTSIKSSVNQITAKEESAEVIENEPKLVSLVLETSDTMVEQPLLNNNASNNYNKQQTESVKETKSDKQ